jgi:hypothetical protein
MAWPSHQYQIVGMRWQGLASSGSGREVAIRWPPNVRETCRPLPTLGPSGRAAVPIAHIGVAELGCDTGSCAGSSAVDVLVKRPSPSSMVLSPRSDHCGWPGPNTERAPGT